MTLTTWIFKAVKETKHQIHPITKDNLGVHEGKTAVTTAAPFPTFTWLSFNKLSTEHARIMGYWVIRYEHNLPSNGGYPLSPTEPDCHPFINVSPSWLRRSNPPTARLSIGSDTVWSVYHRTSNTGDSIRLWREIAQAECWPTDGR